MKLPTVSYKGLPDDEGVDRIVIEVVPRFKESKMSGDEWRVSAVAKFYRKGKLLFEKSTAKMEWAVNLLPYWWLTIPENSNVPAYRIDDTVCAQPGCQKQPVVTYRLKSQYSAQGEGPLPELLGMEKRRAFCVEHGVRGDCGLEDADSNYEQVQ